MVGRAGPLLYSGGPTDQPSLPGQAPVARGVRWTCWTSAGPDVPQRNAGKMGTSLRRLDILDFFPGRSRLPVTLAGSCRGSEPESFQRRKCGTSPECPDEGAWA